MQFIVSRYGFTPTTKFTVRMPDNAEILTPRDSPRSTWPCSSEASGVYVYGVCRRRGCLDPSGGNSVGYCPAHWEGYRAKANAAKNRIRDERKRQGLCIRCGRPAELGCSMCRPHLDDNNKPVGSARDKVPQNSVDDLVESHSYLTKLIQGYAETVPSWHREDFEQELWLKLLSAGIFKHCAKQPSHRLRAFLQVSSWRLALNCRRTLRRRVDPVLPVDPYDAVLDGTSVHDEELLAHKRHLFNSVARKFPALVEDGLAREGSCRKPRLPSDPLFKKFLADA